MNGIGWLFVYTPLPWLAAVYVAAYRHDIVRLTKPFKDCTDLTAWWTVCTHLGLIKADVPRPARKVWESKTLLALLAIALVSVIGPLFLAPLGWYYVVLCQIASAVGAFPVVVNRIGPLPSRPYADVLPYPRLGTRVRHLGTGTKRNPSEKSPVSSPKSEEGATR